MSRNPRNRAADADQNNNEAAADQTPATVLPVVALHRITHGNRQVALANTIFTPDSEDQARELRDLQATRRATAAEIALYEKLRAAEGAEATGATDDSGGDADSVIG